MPSVRDGVKSVLRWDRKTADEGGKGDMLRHTVPDTTSGNWKSSVTDAPTVDRLVQQTISDGGSPT